MHKRKFSDSDNNDAVYDRPYNLMQFPFFRLLLLPGRRVCVCNRVTDAATIVGVTVSRLPLCVCVFFLSLVILFPFENDEWILLDIASKMWRVFDVRAHKVDSHTTAEFIHKTINDSVFEYVAASDWVHWLVFFFFLFLLPNGFVFIHLTLCGLNLFCVRLVFFLLFSEIAFYRLSSVIKRNCKISSPEQRIVWNWIQFAQDHREEGFFCLIHTGGRAVLFLLLLLSPRVSCNIIFSSKSQTNISVVGKCFSHWIGCEFLSPPNGNGKSINNAAI